MAKHTRTYNLRDFTGGLNLVADTFRLAENESPDLLNVDIDRRGGFQVRRGVKPYVDNAGGVIVPRALWNANISGSQFVLAQKSGTTDVYYSSGGSWISVTSTLGNSTQDVCPVVFNNVNYWVRGNHSPVKWDGSTTTTLTSSFNDTTTPSSGNVPRANHMAVHAGYMWVADTYESGTRYPNRVRWSWANTFNDSGENWRSDDYIDIDDGKDSDSITAIVPYGDQLIVFKRDSVYAVYGYSRESFSVVNISNTIGAVSHAAAIATPAGLFFFDHQTGVHVYTGSGLNWVFEAIWPALRDGSIPSADVDDVNLGWVNNRLWVSVPWVDLPTVPRGMTFVLDPFVKQNGAWTKFDLQVGPYCRGHRTENSLAYLHNTSLVFNLDFEGQYYDDFGYVIGDSTIDAWYRTRWIDLGEPAMKKRWRRTEALMQVDQGYELPVVVYQDYDPTVAVKSFKFVAGDAASTAGESLWDDPASTWDTAKWAREGTYGMIDRGSSLGVARAVSLKVGGKVKTIADPVAPQAPIFWGVDALILKYVPRRIR